MFDIGFAEILLIGVVGLLVVGPEQLPGAVRTSMAWINRFRRSFDQIRTEVRRELHNDEVMQKLQEESREFEQQVRDTTRAVDEELRAIESLDAPQASAEAAGNPEYETDHSPSASGSI
jgi:sec-independent protein translocase protein TatB